MPLAPANRTNAAQAAGEKPRVRPYHGTRIAAAANVSANISALVQTRGGVCSLRVVSDMRVNLSRRGSRGGTYVVFEYAAPVRHLWDLDPYAFVSPARLARGLAGAGRLARVTRGRPRGARLRLQRGRRHRDCDRYAALGGDCDHRGGQAPEGA